MKKHSRGIVSTSDRTIRGSGGYTSDQLCPKHGVPMIFTITDACLCAVCEASRANEAERILKQMERKLSHGCIDMNCKACDRRD